MTNQYSAVPAIAKRALIMAAEEKFDQISRSAGVADQMNAAHLSDVIEEIQSMTRVQAYKMAKAIDMVEQYDPNADKFGFGPRVVNPMDFLGFRGQQSISEFGRLI